jgi:transposase
MTVFVGIDIAKASFATATCVDGTSQTLGVFPNTRAGFEALVAQLREAVRSRESAVQVIIEPTGGYEVPLARFVLEHGWQVSMPNPRHVRDWAKSQGRRAKTDAQDALLLARYGAEQPVRPWRPLPAAVSELESLLQRRDDLEQLIGQERNRQHALGHRPDVAPAVDASVAAILHALEASLSTVTRAINEHLEQQPRLREGVRLLRTVPGVGERNVLWLLVLLHRWQTLTDGEGLGKGLVAYLGLDPQPFESGSSVRRRARISRMGAAHLRRRLFMSALGGTRGHNALRQFYLRLVGRGKPKKVALIAAARKVLVWAWAVFRTRTAFDPTRIPRRPPMLPASP